MAPTPPPDIDLAAWRASIDLIESWQPRALAVTHFGVHDDVAVQLGELRRYLEEIETLAGGLDEDAFTLAVRERVARAAAPAIAATYEQAMPPGQSYAGLRRHLRREQGAPGTA
jgi:hypothetical protein